MRVSHPGGRKPPPARSPPLFSMFREKTFVGYMVHKRGEETAGARQVTQQEKEGEKKKETRQGGRDGKKQTKAGQRRVNHERTPTYLPGTYDSCSGMTQATAVEHPSRPPIPPTPTAVCPIEGSHNQSSRSACTQLEHKQSRSMKHLPVNPRDVRAGAPIRMPPGVSALLSPGTVFLLVAMFTTSSISSTRAPSICCRGRQARQGGGR